MKISELTEREVEIYNAGFAAGYDDGKEEGDAEVYEDGYAAGCHNTLEDIWII